MRNDLFSGKWFSRRKICSYFIVAQCMWYRILFVWDRKHQFSQSITDFATGYKNIAKSQYSGENTCDFAKSFSDRGKTTTRTIAVEFMNKMGYTDASASVHWFTEETLELDVEMGYLILEVNRCIFFGFFLNVMFCEWTLGRFSISVFNIKLNGSGGSVVDSFSTIGSIVSVDLSRE